MGDNAVRGDRVKAAKYRACGASADEVVGADLSEYGKEVHLGRRRSDRTEDLAEGVSRGRQGEPVDHVLAEMEV